MTAVAIDHPPRTVSRMGSPFTAEYQVAAPVRAWLCGQTGVVGVGDEIDAGCGIADLVAGCSPSPELPARSAFTDPLTTRLLELAQQPVGELDLRCWAPHGWRSLQRRTIGPLLATGQLAIATTQAGTTYIATVGATDPFSSLIAVELKLRDWRRAVAQAGRYRLFAERSYVALPEARMSSALVAQARRNQVGVLSIDEDHAVRVVEPAPVAGPLQPLRRRWASERLLHALRHPSERPAGSPIR